jgi:hypothetical protein
MTPDRVAKSLKKLIAHGQDVIATTQQVLYEPEMVDQALATEWGGKFDRAPALCIWFRR